MATRRPSTLAGALLGWSLVVLGPVCLAGVAGRPGAGPAADHRDGRSGGGRRAAGAGHLPAAAVHPPGAALRPRGGEHRRPPRQAALHRHRRGPHRQHRDDGGLPWSRSGSSTAPGAPGFDLSLAESWRSGRPARWAWRPSSGSRPWRCGGRDSGSGSALPRPATVPGASGGRSGSRAGPGPAARRNGDPAGGGAARRHGRLRRRRRLPGGLRLLPRPLRRPGPAAHHRRAARAGRRGGPGRPGRLRPVTAVGPRRHGRLRRAGQRRRGGAGAPG